MYVTSRPGHSRDPSTTTIHAYIYYDVMAVTRYRAESSAATEKLLDRKSQYAYYRSSRAYKVLDCDSQSYA